MRHPSLIRVFAVYMVLLYLWAFYLEPRILLHCDKPYRIFLHKVAGVGVYNAWYWLFLAPSILYIIAASIIAPLAFRPNLMKRRRYARLLAYALAPFATALISGASSFCPGLDDLYEFTFSKSLYTFWFTIGYPLAYTAYAYLAYRIFDPTLKEVDPSELMPRFYKISTKAAKILGIPLLAFSIGALLLLLALSPFGMLGLLLYPALGLYLAGSRFRDKPYRFLIAFPLFGQAACWRSFIFDLGLLVNNALARDSWVIPSSAASLIAPLSAARWLLFPVPGFGGAQASLALSDFLEHRFYDKLTWITSPPTFITPLWLFGEWLIFYKAVSKTIR